MKYKVVPIEPTDLQKAEMFAAIIIDRDDYYFTNPNDVYQAAIAAAPDTSMIAVNKVKFEALLNKLECDRFQFFHEKIYGAQALVAGYIQALKDMEGDNG